MQQNVGTLDARIRLVLAVVFFALAAAFNHVPVAALAAAVLALILAGTSLTRSCPIYRALRWDTRRAIRSRH